MRNLLTTIFLVKKRQYKHKTKNMPKAFTNMHNEFLLSFQFGFQLTCKYIILFNSFLLILILFEHKQGHLPHSYNNLGITQISYQKYYRVLCPNPSAQKQTVQVLLSFDICHEFKNVYEFGIQMVHDTPTLSSPPAPCSNCTKVRSNMMIFKMKSLNKI